MDSITVDADRASTAYRLAAKCGRRTQLADTSAKYVGRYHPTDVEPLTRFHSAATLNASVADMYEHLSVRCPAFDEDTGLIAVTLMLRYQRMTGLPITNAMLHRLFLTAVLVASKSHHDGRNFGNSTLARLFGLPLPDLNLMERRFLFAIDYRAAVFASDCNAALAELASNSLADGERADDSEACQDQTAHLRPRIDHSSLPDDERPSTSCSTASDVSPDDGNTSRHRAPVATPA